jgi:hypothetical protein
MSTVKTIFIQNAAGAGYGYFKGVVADLDSKAHDDLVKLKIARAYDKAIDEPTPINDIPADIPGYKIIIASGFTSLSDLNSSKENLTELNGIGNKLAKQIIEYLK